MGVSTRACRFASRVGRDSQSTGTRKGRMTILLFALLLTLTACRHECTYIKKPPEGCPKGYTLVDVSGPDGQQCILEEPDKGCFDPTNSPPHQ
jgi:hypothetical protein